MFFPLLYPPLFCIVCIYVNIVFLLLHVCIVSELSKKLKEKLLKCIFLLLISLEVFSTFNDLFGCIFLTWTTHLINLITICYFLKKNILLVSITPIHKTMLNTSHQNHDAFYKTVDCE